MTNERNVLLRYGVAFANDQWVAPENPNHVWVIIEGEDNVGKTTLANHLKYRWSLEERKVVVEAFGKYFDQSENTPFLWRLFVNEFIVRQKDLHEAYERGFSIIQDRSFLSTMVYQEDYTNVLTVMDAVYTQWAYMPTHIFILPPYGRYDFFREVSRIVFPLSGRSISIVCIPEELNTPEERAEFIYRVLRGEVSYELPPFPEEDDTNAEDTAEGDTEDGGQGEHDDSGGGLEFSGFVRQATDDIAAALSASPIHTNGTSADTADIQVPPPVPAEDNRVGTAGVSPIYLQEG